MSQLKFPLKWPLLVDNTVFFQKSQNAEISNFSQILQGAQQELRSPTLKSCFTEKFCSHLSLRLNSSSAR